MTLPGALRIILRRWYMMLAALLATAALFVMQYRSDGVWTAQPTVAFVAPWAEQVTASPNGNSDAATAFAFGIVQQYNAGLDPEPLSQSTAPLYGVGVRKGVLVSMANTGDQWAAVINQPLVDIQVVGPSAAWVHTTEESAITQLSRLAAAAQAGSDVSNAQAISVQLQPLTDTVQRVAPGKRTVMVAAGAFGVAGLIVGAALCSWCDRLVALRRRRAQRPRFTFIDFQPKVSTNP